MPSDKYIKRVANESRIRIPVVVRYDCLIFTLQQGNIPSLKPYFATVFCDLPWSLSSRDASS